MSSSPPGTPTSKTAAAPDCKRGSRRSRQSSAPCSSTPPARARAPSTTATSRGTASSAGPPSGPSPTPTASNRPTTTPNAASAAPSSTANSHSAANPNAANAPSNDSSPPQSPAGSANSRSSPTSPSPSPPTPAATQYPHSPDPQGLNAYRWCYSGRSSKRTGHRTQSRSCRFADSSWQGAMRSCRHVGANQAERGGHRSRAGSLDLATRTFGVERALRLAGGGDQHLR